LKEVGGISVHSGRILGLSKKPTVKFEFDQENYPENFPDNSSSNYTHHPYS
jgi:hypothetical protein